MRKKQKHQTPNTETQVPITKSIITERIFRLSIHNEFYRYLRFSMFLLYIHNKLYGLHIQLSKHFNSFDHHIPYYLCNTVDDDHKN